MKKLLFLALALPIAFLSSCKDDETVDNQFTVVVDDLKGTIPTGDDIKLDASQVYTLSGTLIIADGAKLTIPAGTKIVAEQGFASYVLVAQGGKLIAEGTAAKPIVFTSKSSTPAAGDWGGIIINGYAPISGETVGTSAACEMNSAYMYGGTNAADNSGILKYVSIEYAGARSSSNIEHNGLTLDAVGSGTVIENIYVLESADDAVEFFGGSVNVTNFLAVNQDDDMFDVTQGWNGTLSNAYGIWEAGYTSTESDPRGIEADGNFDGNGPDHVGQSDFTMTNISIINNSNYEMEDCIKVRRGATATITNCLVKNGKAKDLVDLTDGSGLANNATSIAVTSTSVTLSAKEINATKTIDGVEKTCTATVNVAAGNTGATTTVFAWTSYQF